MQSRKPKDKTTYRLVQAILWVQSISSVFMESLSSVSAAKFISEQGPGMCTWGGLYTGDMYELIYQLI